MMVWPGTTTFAASCSSQNGRACVPGPESLQYWLLTYSVGGAEAVACARLLSARGVAARPMIRAAAMIPVNPT
jgi:hypothetical protein